MPQTMDKSVLHDSCASATGYYDSFLSLLNLILRVSRLNQHRSSVQLGKDNINPTGIMTEMQLLIPQYQYTRYHFRVQLQRNQSPVHSHVSHTLGTSVPQDRIAFNQPLLLLVCLHLHIKYGFRNHDAMSVVFLRKNFHSNARLAANMGLFLGTFQPWPETDLPSDDPIASLHCDQRAGNLSCSGFCASIKLCSLGFTIRIEMSTPTLANRCHQQRVFSRKHKVFSRKGLNQRNFDFILYRLMA